MKEESKKSPQETSLVTKSNGKRKTLGIGIDGVVRDMHSQFDKMYRRVFIINEALVEADETMSFAKESEITEDESAAVAKKIDDLINVPIDSFDLLNHYKFENREELNKFMFENYAFQIFGSASQYPRTMDSINMIQAFGEANDLYDTVLISKEKDQGIIATYHFLAKHGCKIKNISFVQEYEDKWKNCDVVIDDCPEVFENKPEGKKSIKINHLYNSYSEVDYSFDSIKDVYNKEFLYKLFTSDA